MRTCRDFDISKGHGILGHKNSVDLGFGGFWSMLTQNFKGYRNETQALVDFWSETLTSCNFGGGIPRNNWILQGRISGSPRDDAARSAVRVRRMAET